MSRTLLRLLTLGATALTLALFTPAGVFASPQTRVSGSTGFTVVGTGLNNPRGLTFGPDGNIYVAEGGTGGTHSTVGQCTQVPAVGPYTGGKTARISKISSSGVRSTVVDSLPSDQANPAGVQGGSVSGVSDVKFLNGRLYALFEAGGCSHGNPDVPNGIIKVDRNNHKWHLIADLGHFIQTHPVKNPSPDDFEPDGTWYSMTAVGNSLYPVEPNHGELDRVKPTDDQDNHGDSIISRVIDVSATQGHAVPTGSTFYKGNFYVTSFTGAYTPGIANVYKITPGGRISAVVSGLPFIILGIAFDCQGRMLLLEPSTDLNNPAGTGVVVRMTTAGTFETVVSGLTLPTAMTFGPDGRLYLSNFGISLSPTAGDGQVVRSTAKLNSCD